MRAGFNNTRGNAYINLDSQVVQQVHGIEAPFYKNNELLSRENILFLGWPRYLGSSLSIIQTQLAVVWKVPNEILIIFVV